MCALTDIIDRDRSDSPELTVYRDLPPGGDRGDDDGPGALARAADVDGTNTAFTYETWPALTWTVWVKSWYPGTLSRIVWSPGLIAIRLKEFPERVDPL
jgi:hypothetical protein